LLFTDLSCERVIRALKKAGFEIIKQGKHTSMAKGNCIVSILPIYNLFITEDGR